MATLIGALRVVLGLETATFERDTRRAMTATETMRSGMTKAVGAIGAAFAASSVIEWGKAWVQASRDALEAAGAIGEVAQQVGVSAEALQEFRFAASQNGVAEKEMDNALGQLTRRLGQAAEGAKAPTKALERLGITLADIKGKSTDQVYLLIADGLAKMSDASARATIEADLFGRTGQKLDPILTQGAAGFKAAADEARKLGIVLSDEVVAGADEAADRLTVLDKAVEMQKNAMFAKPENIRAVESYSRAMAGLELGLVKVIAQFQTWDEEFLVWTKEVSHPATKAAFDGIRDGFLGIGEWMGTASKKVGSTVSSILGSIGNMVTGIGSWITTRLSAIWQGALDKIETVKNAFRNLWDAVIGHSYIPDMVDGIAAEMARLDAVMVAPVAKATSKAQQAFREMADRTRALLSRLFPEVQRMLDYQQDLADLRGTGNAVGDRSTAAESRLRYELAGVDPSARPDITWMEDVEPLTDGIEGLGDSLQRLGDRAKVNAVKIAESFKDMADKTLQSLSRLTSAIKGGGFLGILEAVIGFGLQLGSVGAFGKGIANRLNATPRALGGPISAGMPYLVGERGPELVVPRHSGRVVPNGGFGGGVMEIRPSPLFQVYLDGKLVQAMPIAAEAGGRAGLQRMAYARSRSLAG